MKIVFLLVTFGLFANPFTNYGANQKIAVQNSILAKVNGKTISVIDLKKKMDLVLHQHYPELSDSNVGKFQFYEASWRRVLRDMIDQELIIADALDKEIKLSDGDVREAMEERFGPNVMQTLDKIGFTYDEAWKMIKNELIAQRMNWWFIQSKAMSIVTPQDIRQAYRTYLQTNPPYSEWKYQVISLRLDTPNNELVGQIFETIETSGKSPSELEEILKSFETVQASISKEFVAKTQDLSEAHKTALENLTFNTYSKPSFQKGKDQKALYRIFYLAEKTDHPAPAFETLSAQIRNDLIGQAMAKESENYLGKLRKFYGYDNDQAIPDDLQPFSLQ